MDNTNFPTKIILQEEADILRHDFRKTVQKVQAAFLELRSDTDFLMPDWQCLSTQYVVDYFKPFLDSLKSDITLDDAQRQKLIIKWQRKKASAVSKAATITNGIGKTPQLKWQLDEKVKLPVPTASIDNVADKMAMHDVPTQAACHWGKLQKVVEAYKDLRLFEDSNKIARKPLQWLFRQTQDTFASQWVSKGFEQSEAPDSATATRWEIINKSIF